MSLFHKSPEQTHISHKSDALTLTQTRNNQLSHIIEFFYPDYNNHDLFPINYHNLNHYAYPVLAKIFAKISTLNNPQAIDITKQILALEQFTDFDTVTPELLAKVSPINNLCKDILTNLKSVKIIQSNNLINVLPELPDGVSISTLNSSTSKPDSFGAYLQQISSRYQIDPQLTKLIQRACLAQAQNGLRELNLKWFFGDDQFQKPGEDPWISKTVNDEHLLTAQIINTCYHNKFSLNPYLFRDPSVDGYNPVSPIFKDFVTNIKKLALQSRLILIEHPIDTRDSIDLTLSWNPDYRLNELINKQNKELSN